MKNELVDSISYLAPLDDDKLYSAVLLNLTVDGYIHTMSVPLPLDGSQHCSSISVEIGLGYEKIKANKTNDTH
ncbi:hypothetical protein [Okeania sp. SIO2B3]|uniref:hypothetical protein n=1 Tax=Okeania sp. SIO2B3 TaxID=2607784 RepID=UPI0013C0296D|nr:hypothetical protein [Okeania sp. SIO2B3]NET40850.1 hypothetical protein [Okeania sp. SIO2B3]